MSGNTFGKIFRVTTFGESHGKALGCVIDGCPLILKLMNLIYKKTLIEESLDNQNILLREREDDKVEILSGVFNGVTTGTPIALLIFNKTKSLRTTQKLRVNSDLVMQILHIKKNME